MLIQRLLAPLVPSSCYGCKQPGPDLCLNCMRTQVSPYDPRCFACHWGSPRGTVCLRCQPCAALAGTTVAMYYSNLMQTLVRRLKQVPDARLAALLARLMARRVMRSGVGFTMATVIPTSPSRYRERGYNPAELVAQELARQLGLPYRPTLLRLTTRHQIGLDRSHRLKAISGAFVLDARARTAGETILLVDDVMTTGATLDEAARVLRQAGATLVWGAVVARH